MPNSIVERLVSFTELQSDLRCQGANDLATKIDNVVCQASGWKVANGVVTKKLLSRFRVERLAWTA